MMWHRPPDRIVLASVDGQLEFILYLVVLVCLIAGGIWCIVKVKRWGRQDGTITPQEDLAFHQRLLEEGLLTQDEFDRVRRRLEGAQAAEPTAPVQQPPPPDAGETGKPTNG